MGLEGDQTHHNLCSLALSDDKLNQLLVVVVVVVVVSSRTNEGTERSCPCAGVNTKCAFADTGVSNENVS